MAQSAQEQKNTSIPLSISAEYDKKEQSYNTIMFIPDKHPKITGMDFYSAYTFTNEKWLSALVKLRAMEKPILWDISLSKIYELKEQTWFEYLNKIENGDMISITYHSIVHDDFIVVIDFIKQFRLEKIFIKFLQKLDPSIIKLVSSVTRTQVYYNYDCLLSALNDYTKFED